MKEFKEFDFDLFFMLRLAWFYLVDFYNCVFYRKLLGITRVVWYQSPVLFHSTNP